MPSPRIYCDIRLGPGAQFSLPQDAANHVGKALRLRAGDALVVFDGRGGEYEAAILRIDRDRVDVKTGAFRDAVSLMALYLHFGEFRNYVLGRVGAEIGMQIAENVPDYLLAPVTRVAAPNTPAPFSPVMEKFYIPQPERIAATVRKLVQEY